MSELEELKERVTKLESQLALLLSNQQQAPSARYEQAEPYISQPVPMAATRVVMNQLIFPAMTDSLGICFGGEILAYIDLCAGLSAKSLARGACVTASLDEVIFLKPCRLGSVLIIAAMVNRTFTSSMEVGVTVEAEDMKTGERSLCCSAHLTFVSLAEKGLKRPVLPRVVPSNEDESAVHEDAEARRSKRLSDRSKTTQDPALRLQPITHRTGSPSLPPSLEGLSAVTPASSNQTPGGEHSRIQVRPESTTAYMTQSILPQHANTLGITFGGQILAWIEQVAFISASRMRQGPHFLTAGIDSVSFAAPTRVGDILYLTSQVTAIFSSSMEVMVSVHGENPSKGQLFHCADAFVVVVTVEAGETEPGGGGHFVAKPLRLPFELSPSTSTETLRFEGAVRRRGERLKERKALSMKSLISGVRSSSSIDTLATVAGPLK